jgi:hypothetical protein
VRQALALDILKSCRRPFPVSKAKFSWAKQKAPRRNRGAFALNIVMRVKRSVLGRPGSDLVFQALRLSTIGAEDFDGRVRDGIGYRLLAIATRPAKDGCQ